MHKDIKDFLSFLDKANSRFTASEAIISRLQEAGYLELCEKDNFKLKKGGKYYIRRMDTAVIAFCLGTKLPADTGFHLASSHIDSPALKLKTGSFKCTGDVCRMGVEVYGGPIISTWLDRELGVSGRVIIKNGKSFVHHSIDLEQPLAIIPNAAIHINREINKGFEYNAQNHLQAVLSVAPAKENPILKLIAQKLNTKIENIVGEELYLYDFQKAALIGSEENMLCSGRLDNLAMTHAILQGLLQSKKAAHTSIGIFFDHEEIGSQTPQGAYSALLGEILERICLALGLSKEDYYRALRQSYMISADMAHAFHPAYAEKYEPDYSPKMNQGIVIKLNANHRYASTAESSSYFIQLCEAAKVKYQRFLVRSDMPCGSTVGPILAANLGLNTIDIGNPMWAMHSVRETCGTEDHLSLIKLLSHYYS